MKRTNIKMSFKRWLWQYWQLPEEMPAAAPAATSAIFLSLLCSINCENPFAVDFPISTLGPSGPNEQPVPNVTAAWIAFTVGKIPARKSKPCVWEEVDCFIWSNISNKPHIMPTMTPPVTGTKRIRCHVSANLWIRSQAAPSIGVPAHTHSCIICT